jgi:hypothetical protein
MLVVFGTGIEMFPLDAMGKRQSKTFRGSLLAGPKLSS